MPGNVPVPNTTGLGALSNDKTGLADLFWGRWGEASRRALVDLVRAKWGRRESDFVRRFDRHRPLRGALSRWLWED